MKVVQRTLDRLGMFWQLLVPSLLAAVLSVVVVQAWTLHVSQQELEIQMARNVEASMDLVKAYLSPAGQAWSRVDGQLLLGATPVQDKANVVDLAVKATGGMVTIFNGDQRVVTNVLNDGGTRAIGTRLTNDAVRQVVLQQGQDFRGRATVLGRDYLTFYQPLRDKDGNVVGILFSGIPATDLDAAKFRTLLSAFAAGLVAVGLFALVRGWLLVLTLRPLNRLDGAMKRIAAGDLSTTVPATDRQDQVGSLARTLQMLQTEARTKLQVEAEAEKERSRARTERMQAEADRAEAAAQQTAVVRELAASLSRLSAGDVTCGITINFAAEYEGLRSDFNAAIDQLRGALSGVVSNAAAIHAGSEEIAQASDDLSRRTEQQAANLEQTAAALNEITETVRRTAENSTQAQAVVTAARTDAEQSGLVVRDAVQAMSKIESSAREVEQIVGVIDEIAFQTNLLALNAGVEAARAGDAGRGFAVVASEVRVLAQRSAEAAREIKALIQTSSQQVGRGVILVNQTGDALERITTQVKSISSTISDITASAREQATGLVEVNTAVNQMDQVTQQNAAMVEQSTAASHALSQEAAALAELTGRFQLGEAATMAVSPVIRRPIGKAAPIAAKRPVRLKVVPGGHTISASRATADNWTDF